MTIKEIENQIKELTKKEAEFYRDGYCAIQKKYPGFSEHNANSPGYPEFLELLGKSDEMCDEIEQWEENLRRKRFEEENPSVARKIQPLPRLTPGWVVVRTIEEGDDNEWSSCVKVLTTVAAITQTEEAARAFVIDHQMQDEEAGNYSVKYHIMQAGDDYEDFYGHAE